MKVILKNWPLPLTLTPPQLCCFPHSTTIGEYSLEIQRDGDFPTPWSVVMSLLTMRDNIYFFRGLKKYGKKYFSPRFCPLV